jgi:hypothetical protein
VQFLKFELLIVKEEVSCELVPPGSGRDAGRDVGQKIGAWIVKVTVSVAIAMAAVSTYT